MEHELVPGRGPEQLEVAVIPLQGHTDAPVEPDLVDRGRRDGGGRWPAGLLCAQRTRAGPRAGRAPHLRGGRVRRDEGDGPGVLKEGGNPVAVPARPGGGRRCGGCGAAPDPGAHAAISVSWAPVLAASTSASVGTSSPNVTGRADIRPA